MTDLLHQLRRRWRGLSLAAAVVVGDDGRGAVPLKAGEQALHGAQRHGELRGDVGGGRLLLPAAKKAACGGGPEERVASGPPGKEREPR